MTETEMFEKSFQIILNYQPKDNEKLTKTWGYWIGWMLILMVDIMITIFLN